MRRSTPPVRSLSPVIDENRAPAAEFTGGRATPHDRFEMAGDGDIRVLTISL